MSTGRVCDGYPSVFRVTTVGSSLPSTAVRADDPGHTLSIYRPSTSVVSADDINKLAQSFTFKHSKSSIEYYTEARTTMAKLSDPTIRHALISLFTVHGDLESRRHSPRLDRNSSTLARTNRGLDEYNTAISSLASRLGGDPSPESVQVALLCCRLFISVEIMLSDYASAIRHLLYGLRIMHQYHSRPAVSGDGRIVPSCGVALPHIDTFIIKLFSSGYPHSRQIPKLERANLGPVPPGVDSPLCSRARSEVASLSAQTSELLGNLTGLRARHQIAALRDSRSSILELLQSWEWRYHKILQELIGDGSFAVPVRVNALFSILLHGILKVVLSLAMSASNADVDALEEDFQNLTSISRFATQLMKR